MKFTRQVSFFGECNSTIVKEHQVFMVGKIIFLNLLSRIEDHLTAEEARPYVSLVAGSMQEETKQVSARQIPAEDIVEIKPNFMGIGLNLNALWHKLFNEKT